MEQKRSVKKWLMIYTSENMPWKLILTNKYGKQTFYKSSTIYLSYNEASYDASIQRWKNDKVQVLQKRCGDNTGRSETVQGLLL